MAGFCIGGPLKSLKKYMSLLDFKSGIARSQLNKAHSKKRSNANLIEPRPKRKETFAFEIRPNRSFSKVCNCLK